eukprot:8531377-Pyramimonas_sp.AAC.1
MQRHHPRRYAPGRRYFGVSPLLHVNARCVIQGLQAHADLQQRIGFRCRHRRGAVAAGGNLFHQRNGAVLCIRILNTVVPSIAFRS